SADPLAGPDAKAKVKPTVPLQVYAFGLEEVRLLPGTFEHAMELDKEYLLSLEVDRLLHNFRVNAGLPSTAKPLGGWEAPDCELRGHFVGHYLSACALMYASTGDKRLKEKGEAVVAGLAECQAKLGSGYLSAYPESFIDRVEKRVPVWAPYYTLHKIFAGLQDMYVYCDNQQALDMAKKFGDWAIARNARLTDEQMQAMLQTEHGGMNETLANLYALTGEEKYLQISLRFNHHRVLDPAEQQEDKLTGLHANTQIPKFIGNARQYELTGDSALKTAALFFWNTVTKERSYVIGGHSDGEMFSPKEHLSQALGRNTTETCNTYNMLKLTRHLFCWDPKADYADYYERALYNHILASQNPVTGMMCYYVPLRSGSRRDYNTPNDSFWCCTGTGVENHAKYSDSIYFHNDRDLYVNLFIASDLDWKAKGLKVSQQTGFPNDTHSELRFTCQNPTELVLHIRHPFWATKGFEVEVNGQKQPTGEPASYVLIKRTWQTGDRVVVTAPFTLRTEAFKDNPNRFAIMYGPLVMAAPIEARKAPPAVVADEPTLLASLKPVAGKTNTFAGPATVFRRPGEESGQPVTLAPFYEAYNEHYVTYWDRFTPEQWAVKQEEFKKQLAAQQALEARTVDYVVAGEEQNERDHNFRGESTDVREFNDRSWRMADTNGWFAWDLKVLPNQAQELKVELGANRGGSGLVLLVNDKSLEAASSTSSGQRGPRTNSYALSADLLAGKDKVTVKFQAPNDRRGGSVAAVRVLKTEQDK
ncbi:MAG TPA: beta-L-arabinofuranosidase domain-containing protein, partial [Patescibacteria group bacterium]|nr:beta-L-arabinofuranosidase domain-containing protein [Patescibacteria group bacterium]